MKKTPKRTDRRTTQELLPTSVTQYRYQLNRLKAELTLHETCFAELSIKRVTWLQNRIAWLGKRIGE